jgi:putative spermidine/putrescine transport system substrate-binding protein
MKSIILSALVGASVLIGSPALARDLTVVSWGGVSQENQRKIYYQPFTAETGVPIAEDTWSGGLGLLAAKVSSGNPDWDIVQVERAELLTGCPDGVFEQIDWDVMGGRDSFIPAAQNDCGVGAIVWGTGLAYDTKRLPEGPKSWADFFDTAKFPGKRGLRQGPQYNLEFALMADGVPRDEVYEVLASPEGVDRAFAKLDTIKGDIIWWTAATAATNMLNSNEVTMTSIYSSRLASANRYDGQSFELVKDGSMYNLDYWVVLKGSQQKADAFKLINFMTGADQQAAYADANADAATRLEGIKKTNPEALKYLLTAPDRMDVALMSDDEFWADNTEELTRRFNAWAGQ